MAKLTIGFGVVLVLVSAGFWLATGRTETAALHPAGIGVLLILCGVLSNTENTKQRMIWMHVAVTAGLIGLLLTGIRALLTLIKGTIAANPLGFDERVVIALICLIYVVLCVRSFIAARRTRVL
ncbi:hypothetical protein [Granulicella paludicola]|uniref:hypothetical protein n=1 Tax=Granulicella paludicola TaxID=474951 RepID=UPI0021E07DB8|nr:hypothetical protein [Granulicella paludicola]